MKVYSIKFSFKGKKQAEDFTEESLAECLKSLNSIYPDAEILQIQFLKSFKTVTEAKKISLLEKKMADLIRLMQVENDPDRWCALNKTYTNCSLQMEFLSNLKSGKCQNIRETNRI